MEISRSRTEVLSSASLKRDSSLRMGRRSKQTSWSSQPGKSPPFSVNIHADLRLNYHALRRYGDPRDSMRDVCGPQVADKVNKVWGFTDEGEVNSVWRDCGHDGIWFGVGTSSHNVVLQPHISDTYFLGKRQLGTVAFPQSSSCVA